MASNKNIVTPALDEEFDQFLVKVEEIGSIIRSLDSEDKTEVQDASRRADEYLANLNTKTSEKIPLSSKMDVLSLKSNKGCGQDCGIRVKENKTIINKRSSSAVQSSNVPATADTMSKETFMACVEQDADRRCADKKDRRTKSEALKKEANEAYRSQDYIKALDLYNKAIEEVRDSCVLYTNRALTFLQLELFRRAMEDCKSALRLSPTSLKGLVYKARAHRALGEIELADECVQQALNHHPKHTQCILDAVRAPELKRSN